MKPPTKRKQVKAWALFLNSLNDGATMTFPIYRIKKDALHTKKVYVLRAYSVIPVTITYSLPTPKKNNPSK